MTIMGLDQSFTCSAVVIMNTNGKIIHTELIKTKKDHENKCDEYDRAWNIASQICSLVDEFECDKLNIEGLSFGSKGDATRKLGGLQYCIIAQLRHVSHLNVEIDIIAPTSLKKFATDNGRAKKPEMYEALPQTMKGIIKRNNWRKTTGMYDATDAYFLALKGVEI